MPKTFIVKKQHKTKKTPSWGDTFQVDYEDLDFGTTRDSVLVDRRSYSVHAAQEIAHPAQFSPGVPIH